MIAGTVYGVELNDRAAMQAMTEAMELPPYGKPPIAPVLYIKPRNCFTADDTQVTMPNGVETVAVGATLAIRRPSAGPALAHLAIDLFLPHASFYRPAIAERCRDGFLPLGPAFAQPANVGEIEIVTTIGGTERHRWSLTRLVRPPLELYHEIAGFMTLSPDDMLLCGAAADAPRARAGDSIEVSAAGFPPLRVKLVAEGAA